MSRILREQLQRLLRTNGRGYFEGRRPTPAARRCPCTCHENADRFPNGWCDRCQHFYDR